MEGAEQEVNEAEGEKEELDRNATQKLNLDRKDKATAMCTTFTQFNVVLALKPFTAIPTKAITTMMMMDHQPHR